MKANNVDILITGSIAYDYLMTFPGRFRDHILPDRLDSLSLSFLVDSLVRHQGGTGANIAYTIALLAERPRVMATVGEDFDLYRAWLESHGVDTSQVRAIENLFTASFFVNTDQNNAQIASFYTGAMARASDLSIAEVDPAPELVVISPNDPDAMQRYAHECQTLNIPYAYDPSQQIVRLQAETLRAGIQGAQALFVNDYELGLIGEKTGLSLDALRASVPLVVITRAEHGADVYTADEFWHIAAIAPDTVIDPTGVGDAFRGGFLKGYIHALPLEICGQMGSLAATYCLENQGPQGHHFDLPTFRDRFAQHFASHTELEHLK
jgi:adenosine kinase